MYKIPMTVNGIQQLRQEYDRLITQERPEIIRALSEARAHGDFRENAEYHAAKEKQGLVEAKIRDIENKLANAQVIDISKLPRNGIVVFGTTVHILNITTNETGIYQLVGDDEANVNNGKISINSPIARALVGKRVGDLTQATTPRGIIEMEITKIEYV